jgi:small subunit ribosomal protein S4
VNHGHFAVNGVPTDISSYQLKPGDKFEVRENRREREPFKVAKETLRNHQTPEWLTIDATKLSGSIVTPPSRDQMPLDLNEQLVVEYYSR